MPHRQHQCAPLRKEKLEIQSDAHGTVVTQGKHHESVLLGLGGEKSSNIYGAS